MKVCRGIWLIADCNGLVRLDHNVPEKERFYFRANFTKLERPENVRQNKTDGDNFYRFKRGVSFDNVYVFSWYHGLQACVEKRFSKGLPAQYSFTWSKWMQATSYLNQTDPIPEKVISDLDRPFRHVLNCVQGLPFGPNKHLLSSGNKDTGNLVGGWQTPGVFTHQTGQALGFGNALLNPRRDDGQRSLACGPAQCFGMVQRKHLQPELEPATRVQHSGAVVCCSGAHAPPVNKWDFSAIKNARMTERLRLQFTAEFINALNHPQFTPPITTPTSTAFGQLTGSYIWQRIIEFGIKISF
jgi:hypothetical protein